LSELVLSVALIEPVTFSAPFIDFIDLFTLIFSVLFSFYKMRFSGITFAKLLWTSTIGSPKGTSLGGVLERLPGLGILFYPSKVFGLTPIPSSFEV